MQKVREWAIEVRGGIVMATRHAATTLQQAHRDASTASIQEISRLLQEVLTRRLTAYIAGVRDAKTVTRWATGKVTEIRDYETERRLRTAYEITRLLLAVESPQTIRAWFIGLNPEIDDTSPAEAINEGRQRDALLAARAFMVNG
jgi:hypothetical protein